MKQVVLLDGFCFVLNEHAIFGIYSILKFLVDEVGVLPSGECNSAVIWLMYSILLIVFVILLYEINRLIISIIIDKIHWKSL